MAITVNPVNDTPTVANLDFNVNEDGVLTLSLASIEVDTGTDPEDDAVVTHYFIEVFAALVGELRTSDNVLLDFGGSVTPGGTYPYGTLVTLAATANATSRFAGWAGDSTGSEPVTLVLMTGPRSIQALFEPKTAQTISFPHPGDRPSGSLPFLLEATTSSGLPVNFAVLDGPAVLLGNQLQITGPGLVTVQASQPGDGYYLPAPPVVRSFNAIAPVSLRYSGAGRTLLHEQAGGSPTHLVLETP